MNEYSGKTVFVVEGENERDLFLSFLMNIFPEIGLNKENIIVWGTNIYELYDLIEKEYDSDWYKNDLTVDIPFLVSKKKNNGNLIYSKDCNNIVLLFDYERQDPDFDQSKIEILQKHFNNISEDGMLYINYPMIESYLDMSDIPDKEYFNKKVLASIHNGASYKNQVNSISQLKKIIQLYSCLQNEIKKILLEAGSDDWSIVLYNILTVNDERLIENTVQEQLTNYKVSPEKIMYLKHFISAQLCRVLPHNKGVSFLEKMRELFVCVIKQNLSKAWHIENNMVNETEKDYRYMFDDLTYIDLLSNQGKISRDKNTGYIWVICTALLFCLEYKIFWKYSDSINI